MSTQEAPIDGFWAVLPAGGAGTRLWPLSRAGHPKFLLDLTGSGRSLIQATLDRVAPLTDGRVLVVTGVRHADAVRAQLPQLPGEQVLAEPSPRDSMPAIGYAAAVLERRDPEAVLGSFAADHVIPDPAAFRAVIRQAVEVACTGRLVTIGIEPTGPATGFGYIHQGAALGIEGAESACAVEEFVEKPDLATAEGYLARGGYRWNASMFVVRASRLLELLAVEHPEMVATLRAIAADPSTLEERWPSLTRIAIDHAVAEPAAARGEVAVVPGTFGWDDVGDFDSLATLLPGAQEAPVRTLGDVDVEAVDASGVVAVGDGVARRTVALVGVEDVVVVDTGDALLVTTRERAQDVKRVVDSLKAAGRTDLT